MEVKRAAMMNFEVFSAAAHGACRMKREMLLAHSGPVARALRRDRVLTLRRADEVFDDWHSQKRKSPHCAGRGNEKPR
jgi:hypothetical protein